MFSLLLWMVGNPDPYGSSDIEQNQNLGAQDEIDAPVLRHQLRDRERLFPYTRDPLRLPHLVVFLTPIGSVGRLHHPYNHQTCLHQIGYGLDPVLWDVS